VTLVLVERSDAGAPWPAADELARLGVRASHAFVAGDRRRRVAVYVATDAEAVRRALTDAGAPFDRLWPAAPFSFDGADASAPEAPVVVAERTYPEPVREETAASLRDCSRWCFQTHEVGAVSVYYEAGGRRGLCVYTARDVESVRIANRMAKLPTDAIWGGVLVRPPP